MLAELDEVNFRDLRLFLQKTLNWTKQNRCRPYKTCYTTIWLHYFVSFCWKIPQKDKKELIYLSLKARDNHLSIQQKVKKHKLY